MGSSSKLNGWFSWGLRAAPTLRDLKTHFVLPILGYHTDLPFLVRLKWKPGKKAQPFLRLPCAKIMKMGYDAVWAVMISLSKIVRVMTPFKGALTIIVRPSLLRD